VRRCCLACRSSDDAERDQANSCATCGGSGFRGRVALLEQLSVSGDVARTIALGESAAHITAAARAGGTVGLWDAGLEQVRRGETTMDELRRVIEQPDASARRALATNAPLVVAEALALDDDLTQRFTPSTLESVRESDPLLPRALSANELASNSLASHIGGLGVTEAKVGVVDVYVIRPNGESWRVLVLQRALDTRCPGAWETVHGRIEPGEYPEDAAVREVAEETGLQIERLYSITVQPFYLQALKTVQLAVVFAAFVAEPADITLGEEHQRAEWRSVSEAMERFVWPREREALTHITQLLRAGNAGAVEDVLRVF
jgi:8-oxo-dGTP pyrophosphatase MutT (NUDIX family)